MCTKRIGSFARVRTGWRHAEDPFAATVSQDNPPRQGMRVGGIVPGSRTGLGKEEPARKLPGVNIKYSFQKTEKSASGALYALREPGTDRPNPSYILVRAV